MNDTDLCRSCIDCAAAACNGKGGAYPSFCLTAGMDREVMGEAMAAYRDETNNRITRVAAEIETDGYCRWCRVRETMEFAHRMGFRRIGIAFHRLQSFPADVGRTILHPRALALQPFQDLLFFHLKNRIRARNRRPPSGSSTTSGRWPSAGPRWCCRHSPGRLRTGPRRSRTGGSC